MAAALECWSSRATAAADDDTVEQVLMRTHHRSEGPASTPKDPSSIPNVQKKFQKLTRNVSEAIASFRNSLNLDSPPSSKADASSRKLAWGSVVRNLTQLYPGSQLPEKLMSNIRKHYDSLPLRSQKINAAQSFYLYSQFRFFWWCGKVPNFVRLEALKVCTCD